MRGTSLCAFCSQPFAVPWGSKRKRFCSTSCAALYGNALRYADHIHVPRGKGHRGRAQRYGVAYEAIKPEAVYARDAWQCKLCGDPVDPDTKWPHPLSASVDHVVPMSEGGAHLWTNVQCAHLRCNILKGASTDARSAADAQRAQAQAR